MLISVEARCIGNSGCRVSTAGTSRFDIYKNELSARGSEDTATTR